MTPFSGPDSKKYCMQLFFLFYNELCSGTNYPHLHYTLAYVILSITMKDALELFSGKSHVSYKMMFSEVFSEYFLERIPFRLLGIQF